MEEAEEIESPPAVIPFSCLFAYAYCLNWFLMIVSSLAGIAHDIHLLKLLHQGSLGSSAWFVKREILEV